MPMEHVVTESWPDQTYAVKPQPTPRRRSTPAKISIYKRNTNNQPKKRKAQIKSVAPEAFFCSCCSLALQLQKKLLARPNRPLALKSTPCQLYPFSSIYPFSPPKHLQFLNS